MEITEFASPKVAFGFRRLKQEVGKNTVRIIGPLSLKKHAFEVTCELDEKNILKIESLDDINKLPFLPRQIRSMPTVDWQKLKQSGVDAVYLTERGYGIARSELFRNFGSKANCFYTWDVDSVVVLNERCIKSCQIKQRECSS